MLKLSIKFRYKRNFDKMKFIELLSENLKEVGVYIESYSWTPELEKLIFDVVLIELLLDVKGPTDDKYTLLVYTTPGLHEVVEQFDEIELQGIKPLD